jgi:hypothetical protein
MRRELTVTVHPDVLDILQEEFSVLHTDASVSSRLVHVEHSSVDADSNSGACGHRYV